MLTDAKEMAPYLSDWRGRYHGAACAVVRPGTTQEVAAVVRLCAAAGVPMVPQGGNTGLCGGATPDGGGRAVVLSLGRLDRVRAVDADNNTIMIEAGCTLAGLQQAAIAADRFFPLSLASEGSCTVGGNLSTNAGGVQVLRYGNMRELTLGLEAVLPDGRIWNGLRGLRKDNTGYDLKQLFIGAEGTLGFITAAVLKLFPAIRQRATAWVAVPDPGAAVRLLGMMRAVCSDRVTAFELIGGTALGLVLQHIPGARPPLQAGGEWSVLVELSDSACNAELDTELERALTLASEQGLVGDAVVAGNLAQAEALWALRENISEAQRIEGISIKHDIAIPVSRIPAFLERARAALQHAWPDVRIVAFGHIGDGNLHYNLSKPAAADNRKFISRTPEVNRIVHDLVAGFDGSISAEHGLGQLKRDELLRYKSVVEMDMMRAVKQALDPHGLMNPGKVLAPVRPESRGDAET
ncbi:putative glycolate oxidase subunit GlcD [Thauera linaloolentis 47Lol = DSM 12138]|uniref:Putative glycolate oxidase subunit GlcD n=1 Tax=Thauera linaloolentis (strain DSM 12138 / JCM 21573 / CCUG 41526 / CIP 105981 / IAM 15112 / NBRC 102519 / 47Lol) TaxID=1123367 RepID=N6YF82_THAL4|nr:putative glycolate oxidase subunit GlcD [Thauera linaloolentis 47Lol = DSM 12138]